MKVEMSNKAHGMVFSKSGVPMKAQEFPFSRLKESELLVKIKYATICGSDLHTYRGLRKTPVPTILGHEIIGSIETLPHGNPIKDYYGDDLKVGDSITWSIAASCGDCHYCKINIPQKCRNLFKYGHEQITEHHPLSGGYAEYCHLAKGTTIIKIPDHIPYKVIGPANCATATTAAAFRIGGDCSGKVVIIQGAGMLGLTACAMAKYLGASEIIAIDIDEKRLSLAHKFGATKTLLFANDSDKIVNDVQKITNGYKADLIIEMSGISKSVELGFNLLSIGGHYVLVGSVFTQPSVEISPETTVRSLFNIHGIHNYAPQDLAMAIRFLADCYMKYPFESLISSEFSLKEVNEAFDYSIATKSFRVAVRPNY
jgi:putative phosphonate catabolism associated alcohol dehydrogenase|tara:strand:+ start:3830 stop:4939 length:1110 start_codon:yes stop_codon:yes gene_type:complete